MIALKYLGPAFALNHFSMSAPGTKQTWLRSRQVCHEQGDNSHRASSTVNHMFNSASVLSPERINLDENAQEEWLWVFI